MNKKRIIVVFLLLVFCMSPVITYASSVKSLKEKQENIKKQQERAKDALEDAVEEKNATLEDVVKLDIEFDEVSDELDIILAELEDTNELLIQTEAELEAATIKREEQYEALKVRMRNTYENGAFGYYEILLEAKSLPDFLNMLEYINIMVEHDDKTFKDFKNTEDLIAAKKVEIEEQKAEIEVLAYSVETKKNALEVMLEDKKSYLKALESQEEAYNNQLADLEKSSDNIVELIKKAEIREKEEAEARARAAASSSNAPVVVYNGELMYPVSGYRGVNSHYGWRPKPFNRSQQEFHTGVDLKAPYGASIIAAGAGTVTSSKYMNGYGYTVIISHGNGLSTLYAHNSSLLVSVGDVVSTGQVIAKAGSTGYSTGPHLHFEVRKNGSHVDPRPYIGY